MLRFFRNTRQKLIQNGNLRKYFWYAIGEVFLVVIGILIALQINNWNVERLDRKYEKTMLNEVLNALEKDVSNLEGGLKYLDQIQYSIFELASIKNDPSHPRDSLMYHFNNVAEGGIAVVFNYSPFEAIKSSGMDKVSNPELRKNLSYLYEVELVSVKGWINEIIRESLLEKQRFIRNNFAMNVIPDSSKGISTELIEPEYSWIREHRDFEIFLSLSGNYLPLAKTQIQRAITEMTAMIELLNAERQ